MKAVVVDQYYGSVSAEEYDLVRQAYEAAGIQFVLRHLKTEEEIIIGCADADVLLCTGNPPITRKVMEALPTLKAIQRFGAGVDSIDLNAAAELGILVLNLPGFCAQELADLAAAMILGLIRNTAYYDREIRRGNWPKCQYLLPPDIRAMTLGLFGFGAAGRCLHDILFRGFGTNVIACDPYVSESIRCQYPDVTFVDFEQLLCQSDIISIHVGLTPETRHIFDRSAFTKMKSSAMIINTSRGGIIDQEALVWALESGEIQYAGLDTMEQEPISEDDPLLHMDNVILSPHSGSYGINAKKTQIRMVCELIPDLVRYSRITSAHCIANRAVLNAPNRFQL